MACSGIQSQKGLSLPAFQKLYGTEAHCEAALEKTPAGLTAAIAPAAMGMSTALFMVAASSVMNAVPVGTIHLTAAALMQATKLPLTPWLIAFYLIGHANTGISSLELSHHLGVNYDTAWLLHSKSLRAMSEREEAYLLRRKIQMDVAYLGGERPRADSKSVTGALAGAVSRGEVGGIASSLCSKAFLPQPIST